MLGVDLGTYSFKYCLTRKKRDASFEILKTGDILHPGDLFAQGELQNRPAMVDTIRTIWKKDRLPREACLCFYHPRMVVQNITLPEMSPQEMENALHWEASSIITGEEQFQIGWDVLNTNEGNVEVLFSASPAAAVREHLSLFKSAGIRVEGIEPQALSLIRGFLSLYPDLAEEAPVILIEVGFRKSAIVFFQKGKLGFVRYFGWGLHGVWNILHTTYELPPAEIMEMFKRGSNSEEIPYQMEDAINQAGSDLLSEIKRSLSFFQSNYGPGSLSNCYLTGGGAGVLPLRSYLVDNLSITLREPDQSSSHLLHLLPAIGASLWS